jgi:dCTP deaminase
MILCNIEIHTALDLKRLILDPEPQPRFQTSDQYCPYGTHSVDLQLGYPLLIPQKGPYNYDVTRPGLSDFLLKNAKETMLTKGQGFLLEPGLFVLGMTLERVGLPIDIPINRETNTCLAACIEGKSSRARCGLLIHFTALTVHPGWDGQLALEIINLGPVAFTLYPGMPIAQLIIEEVRGIPRENPSQFQGQTTPSGVSH